jgi:hypothetical protein
MHLAFAAEIRRKSLIEQSFLSSKSEFNSKILLPYMKSGPELQPACEDRSAPPIEQRIMKEDDLDILFWC